MAIDGGGGGGLICSEQAWGLQVTPSFVLMDVVRESDGAFYT